MIFSKFGGPPGPGEWSQKIQDVMEEMLRRSYVRYRETGAWQPATNVYESEGGYEICVDLAGLERDDIEVTCMESRRIVVQGRRAQPRLEQRGPAVCVHVLEIDEGPFRRVIDLPEPIDANGIEAAYQRGFLWIRVPRASKA